ncbi:MAG TPA: hypothetical protein VN758_00435 [Solirubrobacterales bacterium]|nr:hypothetical protein [Solirubrobacterales bacterium]
MPVEGLNDPCAACGRRSGDHTLDEWAKCMGTPSVDLPFEPIPDDAARLASERLRKQFNLDDDVILADSVVVRAALVDAASGQVGIKLPALIHDFQVGVAGAAPATVARVLYLGDVESMRKYGKLIRDSANGAVNAAGRA